MVHAIKVAATHPKLGNAMRVAVTHPCSNMQWNKGGSDTPYVVIKEAMQVSNLRRGVGAPPSLLRSGKSGRGAPNYIPITVL